MENYYEQAQKGAWVSILSYIFLSACKLIIAGVTASSALKADGLNNVTDIIASIAVLVGLKISKNLAIMIIPMDIPERNISLHLLLLLS